MTQYVLGFVISRSRDTVVLVKKRRPAWQAGKCNGVGGKIEFGELARHAMTREYFKEAGVVITSRLWFPVARYEFTSPSRYGRDEMFVYAAEGKGSAESPASLSGSYRYNETVNDEEVSFWSVRDLYLGVMRGEVLHNVPWLVQLSIVALNVGTPSLPLTIKEA